MGEGRGGGNLEKERDARIHTRTHTHTDKSGTRTHRDKTKGGSWVGREGGGGRERQTVTHRGQMAGVLGAGAGSLTWYY